MAPLFSLICQLKKIIALNKIVKHYWYHICCSKQRKFRGKALFYIHIIAADQNWNVSADL